MDKQYFKIDKHYFKEGDKQRFKVINSTLNQVINSSSMEVINSNSTGGDKQCSEGDAIRTVSLQNAIAQPAQP